LGDPRGLRANEVQHENADEQLANPQKRICLIEFLPLGLIIVCQGSESGAASNKKHPFGCFFDWISNTFSSSKVGDQK